MDRRCRQGHSRFTIADLAHRSCLGFMQEKAFIFRITHRDNVPWIMANGSHCRNANRIDPGFVTIGISRSHRG